MPKFFPLIGALVLSLAACTPEKAPETETTATVTILDNQPPAPATDPAIRPDTAMARPTATADGVVIPPIAVAVQPGPNGMQVALTQVNVKGKVLNVELQYLLPPTKGPATAEADISQISYLDNATTRKYPVLKDAAGKYLAKPAEGQHLSVRVGQGKPGIVSLQFPAPPTTSPTFTLNVPGVGAFEGVSIQR